ncbi:N-6 DNA methylase [Winogradskyella sp. Asnod2-B02-A]|uniref:N-6 DNA methylase n=1 Tax=Winogradskyella sp. Asnod2-B02-A TaxID=3160583 RepID=UPI00386380C0
MTLFQVVFNESLTNNRMRYTLARGNSDFGNNFDEYEDMLQRVSDSGEDVDREAFFKALQQDKRLGMHYTPNQFSALIAHSITTQPKTILDPCCGLANILYYLENSFDSAAIIGIEINQNVASIAQLLVPDSKIIAADTFQYSFNGKYDLIVGNIPLGMRLKINNKSISSEEAFTLKTLELLNEKGEAFLIMGGSPLTVPRMQDTRDVLIPHINSIVKLPTPKNSFSGVGRYLMHLTKTEVDEINFGIVEDFRKLKTTINQNTTLSISKTEIKDRLNPEFYISINSSNYDFLDEFETKKLSELTNILRGAYIPRDEKRETGKFLLLKPSEIKDGKLQINERSSFVDEIKNPNHQRYIAILGDIVISTMFNQAKIYCITENDPPIIVTNKLVILRGSENEYLKVYFETETGRKIFNTQANDLSTGMLIPNLTMSSLKEIQIPIFPMDNLSQLGDTSIEHSTQEELENLREQVQFYKEQIEQKDQAAKKYEAFEEILLNRFDKIDNQLVQVHKKLDTILEAIKNLQDDFLKIKNTNRDDEEKIFRLLKSLDRRIKTVLDEKRETMEEYEQITQRWLSLWDDLHPTSQKFLPLAEFLYDELCNIKDADFSPFILQYCRTLENEILIKLFQKYHLEGLQGTNVSELVSFDLKNKTKAAKFASYVKKNNAHYPLGDMHWILNLLKPTGSTFKNSLLLQHFREFVSTYFQEELTSQSFLNQVQTIQQNYRNKAAHVSALDLKSAEECRELLRDCLNEFLELKIKSTS